MRFLLTSDIQVGLDVPYYSAFSPDDHAVSLRNLHYERAGVLFNLAALYSQLAAAEDRLHPDGIKRANAYYQVSEHRSILRTFGDGGFSTPRVQSLI